MRQDSTQPDGSVAFASGAVAGTPAAQADSPPLLGRLPALETPLRAPLRLPRVRVAVGQRAGHLALATLLLSAFAVVVFATAHASPLVPQSALGYPAWEAGPLHQLFGHVSASYKAVNLGFSAILVAMTAAYFVAVAAVRKLSMRTIVICIVALHAILLMSAPLQLNDVFNYLGYARLGALHHVNPYVHGIGVETHDPIYRFSSWHHLRSPYGSLFTVLSYPLALLPIPVAYWVLKVVTVLMSLGFIALIWKCAKLLGRDPRFAVLFVAANPIYLIYAVGGFHNDFFMLVPSTAAIAFLLARRERASGAAVMVAVAVKFTAGLLLPFLIIAARSKQRRIRLLVGAALATIPLVALSFAMFGLHLPNLQDQSTLLTDLSVPNILGWLIGVGGGAPPLLRVLNVAVVLVVALLVRRRKDWLADAGWSTVALLVSLAWLVPWYVIWLLPLAALASNLRLRRVALGFTVFLVLTFMPATGMFLRAHGINPMSSGIGQASASLQRKLAQ
jgi:alpha-1,6-mannosyltransferase